MPLFSNGSSDSLFHEAFGRTMVPSQTQARLLGRTNNYQGANGDQFFFLLIFIKSQTLHWL